MIKLLTVNLILLSCALFDKSSAQTRVYKTMEDTDTLEGYFLYEVNVPAMCYTRFDQIEQGRNMLFFDSLLVKGPMNRLYEKGVFFINYDLPIADYIYKNEVNFNRDTSSIGKFQIDLSPLLHSKDSSYLKSLYFDKTGILSYKKVYAKFSCIRLKKVSQLIPKTSGFECCYSNERKKIDSYIITKIINYRICQ
jgi:hypothetical protein